SAPPDEVRATAEDVKYLIDSVNAFFPNARLTSNDVCRAWAGIRPLLPTNGSTPGSVSREHAITWTPRGLLSITGGKLTTYRVMASQVVDAVAERLWRPSRRNLTRDTPLPGGDFASFDVLAADIARATNDVDLAAHLATAYGSRWRYVLSEISNDGAERLVPALPYTIGEMRYCVRREMAMTIGDLLMRRTHFALELCGSDAGDVPARVATAIAPLLGWSAEDEARAVRQYLETEVPRTFTIDASS